MKKFKLVIHVFLVFLVFACSKKEEEKQYKIGDVGPAGGIIFYDKGVFSDDWRYLEAAQNDHPNLCQNAGVFTTSLETGDGIGKGKSNTEILNSMEQLSNSNHTQASNFESGGYSDWFLPSKDELKLIRTHKDIIPNLQLSSGECKSYYCSTLGQVSLNRWLTPCLNISTGELFFTNPAQRVRCIRQF